MQIYLVRSLGTKSSSQTTNTNENLLRGTIEIKNEALEDEEFQLTSYLDLVLAAGDQRSYELAEHLSMNGIKRWKTHQSVGTHQVAGTIAPVRSDNARKPEINIIDNDFLKTKGLKLIESLSKVIKSFPDSAVILVVADGETIASFSRKLIGEAETRKFKLPYCRGIYIDTTQGFTSEIQLPMRNIMAMSAIFQ